MALMLVAALTPKKPELPVRLSHRIWNWKFLIVKVNFLIFFIRMQPGKIRPDLLESAYYRRTVHVKFDNY